VSDAPLQRVYARSERIVARQISGECILVPIVGRGADVDSIYTLNRVGAFIWEHLDGLRTGQDMVDLLMRRFTVDGDTAREDYVDFVDKLLSINAVSQITR
jgi:hypothetical protein